MGGSRTFQPRKCEHKKYQYWMHKHSKLCTGIVMSREFFAVNANVLAHLYLASASSLFLLDTIIKSESICLLICLHTSVLVSSNVLPGLNVRTRSLSIDSICIRPIRCFVYTLVEFENYQSVSSSSSVSISFCKSFSLPINSVWFPSKDSTRSFRFLTIRLNLLVSVLLLEVRASSGSYSRSSTILFL